MVLMGGREIEIYGDDEGEEPIGWGGCDA